MAGGAPPDINSTRRTNGRGGRPIVIGFERSLHMQNTLPLTPGNPLKNITGLARQISLPGEHAPLRFPSFPALERTAVVGFNTPATLTTETTGATAMTVFRQAAYPVWADQNLSGITYVADYLTEPGAATPLAALDSVTMKPRPALYAWAGHVRVASTVHPGLNGTNVPINAAVARFPLLGRDEGSPGPEWIYVPKNASFGIAITTFNVMTGGFSADVSIEQWESPGQTHANITSVFTCVAGDRGAGNTFSLPANAWIRPLVANVINAAATNQTPGMCISVAVSIGGNLAYTPSVLNAGAWTATLVGASRVHFPLTEPAEYRNSQIPWFAARVTAAAMLGTNVTQLLNKSGTVLGGRLSPAQENAFNCPESVVNNLHPAEKAYLPLETGIYTYCPPSTDLVFFSDYTVNTGGNSSGSPSVPIFLLSNDSMYNKLFLTTGSAAATMAMTVSWHIEFRTSSALFQVGLSAMTLEALHAAQLVLAESGFFFENPEHEGLLHKVINTAKKYAPSVVGTVNPTAGRMLQSVLSKMGQTKAIKPKPGPSKPKTTSLAGAGIAPKPKKGQGKGKGKKK